MIETPSVTPIHAAPQNTIAVTGLMIGQHSFNLNPVTNKLEEADLPAIKNLLAGKRMTLLCSIGANNHCEGKYVKAQILFLYALLEQGITVGLDVVIADSLQRHNHRINHLRYHVAFLANEIALVVKKLSFKSLPDQYTVKKAGLIESVGKLQSIVTPEDDKSYSDRQIIRYRLKAIRMQLNKLQAESTTFANTNRIHINKIFCILNHFDLHITLHALQVTLDQGNKWHVKLGNFFYQFPHPEFRILYWRDLFGSLYSPQQQILDCNQLALLREEYITDLQTQPSTTLDEYEKKILAGVDSEYMQEEEIIIQETLAKLCTRYPLSQDKQSVVTAPQIPESLQTERLTSLQNLYTTGNAKGDTTSQHENLFATQFNLTGDEYLSRKNRKANRAAVGISAADSQASFSSYLIEEGIVLAEPQRVFAYPGEITPALATILSAFDSGPWVYVMLRDSGRTLTDTDKTLKEVGMSGNTKKNQLIASASSSDTISAPLPPSPTIHSAQAPYNIVIELEVFKEESFMGRIKISTPIINPTNTVDFQQKLDHTVAAAEKLVKSIKGAPAPQTSPSTAPTAQ